jgi:hypothetical protein
MKPQSNSRPDTAESEQRTDSDGRRYIIRFKEDEGMARIYMAKAITHHVWSKDELKEQ